MIATPNYSRLQTNADWQDLWSAEKSFVVEEIARIESRLRDLRVTDPTEVWGLRNRLAALTWVRDTVASLALPAATIADADLVAPPPRVWRRLADMVLPVRLG